MFWQSLQNKDNLEYTYNYIELSSLNMPRWSQTWWEAHHRAVTTHSTKTKKDPSNGIILSSDIQD